MSAQSVAEPLRVDTSSAHELLESSCLLCLYGVNHVQPFQNFLLMKWMVNAMKDAKIFLFILNAHMVIAHKNQFNPLLYAAKNSKYTHFTFMTMPMPIVGGLRQGSVNSASTQRQLAVSLRFELSI
ncbi:MAG: hypothetical protein AAF639_04160 [Chloroflexota bacterium]